MLQRGQTESTDPGPVYIPDGLHYARGARQSIPLPDETDPPMTAAFLLFDGLTTLDFVGAYDPITRLRTMGFRPDFDWELCGRSESVTDGRGLRLSVDRVGASLEAYDMLVVPGGKATRHLREDDAFLDWLQTGESVPLKASVCTGSLLFGAAGFLEGVRATTHPNALEALAAYGARTSTERVVDEGPIVTARGVSAGLDLGLHLVERLAGKEARAAVATQMDYPYDQTSG